MKIQNITVKNPDYTNLSMDEIMMQHGEEFCAEKLNKILHQQKAKQVIRQFKFEAVRLVIYQIRKTCYISKCDILEELDKLKP